MKEAENENAINFHFKQYIFEKVDIHVNGKEETHRKTKPCAQETMH